MKKYLNTIASATLGVILGSSLTVFAGTWVDAYKNTEVTLSINGETKILRDATTGEREYPLTYLDRTYIPLRSVATLLGYNVDYDAGNRTVIVNSPDYVAPTKPEPSKPVEDNNNPTGPIDISEIEYLKGLLVSDVKASKVIGTKGDESTMEYYIDGILNYAYTDYKVSDWVHSQTPFKKDYEEFAKLLHESGISRADFGHASIQKYLYDENNNFRGVIATYEVKIGNTKSTLTSIFVNEEANETVTTTGLKLFADIVG